MDQGRRRFLRLLGIGAAVAAGELLLPHRKIWQVGAKICSPVRAFSPEDAFGEVVFKNKGDWIDEHEFVGYNSQVQIPSVYFAPGQLKYRECEALISYPNIPTTVEAVQIVEANMENEPLPLSLANPHKIFSDRIKVIWNDSPKPITLLHNT